MKASKLCKSLLAVFSVVVLGAHRQSHLRMPGVLSRASR